MSQEDADTIAIRAPPADRPINLLDFLEMENTKLRRAVIELSLDTLVLKDALKERQTTGRTSPRASSTGPGLNTPAGVPAVMVSSRCEHREMIPLTARRPPPAGRRSGFNRRA